MKTDIKGLLAAFGMGVGALLIEQLPLIGMASPAILASAGALFGTAGFVAACLPLVAVLFINTYGAGLFAMLVIAGGAGYFASRREHAFDALVICCAGALAGIWALFLGAYLQTGDNLLSYLYTNAAADYADMMNTLFEQAGLTQALSLTGGTQLQEMIANTIPACAILYSVAQGFLLLLVPAAAGRAAKRPSIRVPRFYMWSLPHSFMWGLIFLMAAAYIGLFAKWPGFSGVAYAVQSLFTVALGLQGLSTLVFFYKAYGNPVLLIIGIVSAALFAFTPLTLAGVLDSAFSLRKRWIEVNGPVPEKQPPVRRGDDK